jgi:hypothetical protein
MSKKKRKKSRSTYNRAQSHSVKQNDAAVSTIDSSPAVNLQAASRKSRYSVQEEDFNPDYSDIKKDLRRIGSLAAVFFVVLVTLSFFL